MDVEIKSEVEDTDSIMEADFSCQIYDYSSSANVECLDQSGELEDAEPFTNTLSESCCKVCGDSATGMYFGALVCVPCKTFFLRYGGGNCIFECKFDKNCEITSTSRTQCKYCRYQKCIQAGMCRKVRPTQVHLNEGQQLCVVCNDVANGVHFGAITCEGCKKFFRRGLTEHTTYTCKNEKKCLVNPRTRNSCRYCRYQKCLSAGMSREAIQMGRPSKVRTVNGSGSDGPRLKEPKSSKDGAESEFTGPTDDWLKYYTETARKRELANKSSNGFKKDSSGASPGAVVFANGSKSSIKADLKSGGCVNIVSDVPPLSTDAASHEVESRSDSSVDDERSRNAETYQLTKCKTSSRVPESYHPQVDTFIFAVPQKGKELTKASELASPTSTQLDSPPFARGQFSTKSVSQLISANSGSLNGMFTCAGKWSGCSVVPGAVGLNRALSMSSGGYCELNTTPAVSFRQRAYSDLEAKETSKRYTTSDVILAELDDTDENEPKNLNSFSSLSADNKAKCDGQISQTSKASNGDMLGKIITSSIESSRPFARISPELQTSIPSKPPSTSSPLRATSCSMGQMPQSLLHISEIENNGHPAVATSVESIPSFSSPLSDISLISPNSSNSRSAPFPSSSSKWRQQSDRDSPYCTIFALASSCQLFSEASKNPFDQDGSCDDEMNVFESICSEQQVKVIRKYWLEPNLPDENIIFNEKHKEIIKQILSAYERFVQTGTNINETLRKELENWQTSELNASLPEWIQRKVVPVYTFSSITYCKSLPGFQDFVTKDQATLIRLGQSQSRILVAAKHWYDPQEKKFHDFLSWRSEDLFKKKLIRYAETIHSLELDRIESAVLNVLILISTDYPGLKNPDLIEESRQHFLSAFRAYTTAKYGTPNKRLETLFRHIPECRSLGFLHYKMTMTASLQAEEVERMFPTR